MLKISYAGCLDISPTTSLQFTFEMCAEAKNCKKFKRFMVIGDDKVKKLMTSACYDKQHVCT